MTVTGHGVPHPREARRFEADYEVLRTGVGAVALGRDVLRVSGPDAVEYLQGQLSQDVAALGRRRIGGFADPDAPGETRRPGACVADR